MAFQQLLKEIKKFGILEVADRKMYGYTKNPEYQTRMLIRRDEGYRRFTAGQLEQEMQRIYQTKMKNALDLAHPKYFTEKVAWLSLNESTAEKTRLADKYLVRDWVENLIGGGYLIPLLGVWDKFDDIDFAELPDRFFLKTNHASTMNYMVKDKANMNVAEARELFNRWMRTPFYVHALELQYRDMPRKIIAEAYMEDESQSKGLYDYKIHCFHGEPKLIHCIGERSLMTHGGYEAMYDLDWNRQDWSIECYPLFPYDVPRPKHLKEMLDCAVQLSKSFNYVRVDMYEIGGKVYFGEMTFTPGGGLYIYRGSWTRERDLEMGKLLKLPTDE